MTKRLESARMVYRTDEISCFLVLNIKTIPLLWFCMFPEGEKGNRLVIN